MHLSEPGLQPAGLLMVEAAGRPAGQTVGVKGDEPHRGRVIGVVGGPIQPVVLTEPVPEWPRAGPKVSVDEVAPADRPPEGIRRDTPELAGHKRLGALGEKLKRSVVIEARRQSGWFPVASQRGGQAGCLDAHALVERLVIAEARQPGNAQARGGEFAQRSPQQARMVREAVFTAEEVRAARTRAVRPPEDVTGPVHRLHSLIIRTAGIR